MANFIIFGAGRQGKALGYFLAKHYNANQIAFVDIDKKTAAKTTLELKKLLGHERKTAFLNAVVDDYDDKAVKLVSRFCVLISALPHKFNLALTKLAIQAGTNYCDYGFDENVVAHQLELNESAKQKNVTVIPNCGVEPGLSDIVAVGGAKKWQANCVEIYVGGIASKPQTAFRYAKLFAGVFHEYVGKTVILEDGEIKEVDALGGYSLIEANYREEDYEAFYTRMPFGPTARALREAGVKNAFSKTLRLKGHHQVLMALKELGLLSENGLWIGANRIVPLEVTERLFDQNIPEAENDYMIFRVVFKKDWRKVQQIETTIHRDRETGLSAMQIATSSVVAAIAQGLSRKKFRAGVYLPHEAADFEDMLAELLKMKIAPIMTLKPFLENKGDGG
ncbi:MAG: saccharopine dehydrogenase C-terminal domain-containing protein [Patescibacteria group bacterium]